MYGGYVWYNGWNMDYTNITKPMQWPMENAQFFQLLVDLGWTFTWRVRPGNLAGAQVQCRNKVHCKKWGCSEPGGMGAI